MSYTEPPPPGSLVADLGTLKAYVGARTDQDDELLQGRLTAAKEWVYVRVYEADRASNDVQEAILLLASRLYKRRQSPEGVAGFGAEGVLIRIIARDPDISGLLEQRLDMTRAGIA